MNQTPSHEQAPQAIEQTPQEVAEARERQRLDAVDKLTGEGLELDPEDAYDAYRDFIGSIRESAQAGELVTTAQPEPFTEEQILMQYIDAFDIQRKGGDVSGIRLIPGAHGLRSATRALLGTMAPGSEPSPHAAFLEGMIREAHENLTHPEVAALTGTETEAPVVTEAEVQVAPEAVEDVVEPEESFEKEDDSIEQEIHAQHERHVRILAEQTAESLAKLTSRVTEYEEAGRISVSAAMSAEDSLSTMIQRVGRFEDYGVDGARTMLVRMQDEIGSLARHMNVSGQRVEEPAAAVRASEAEIRGDRTTAERIDSDALHELMSRDMDVANGDIQERGAESVQSVAEDALNTLEPVERAASELALQLGEGGTRLNSAYTEFEDIIRRSYGSGIDAVHVTQVLKQVTAALDTDTIRQRSGKLVAAVNEAETVLRAARQQIEQR